MKAFVPAILNYKTSKELINCQMKIGDSEMVETLLVLSLSFQHKYDNVVKL